MPILALLWLASFYRWLVVGSAATTAGTKK